MLHPFSVFVSEFESVEATKDSTSGLRGATSSIEIYQVGRPKILKISVDKVSTSSMVPVRLSMEWSNLVTNVLLPSGSVNSNVVTLILSLCVPKYSQVIN